MDYLRFGDSKGAGVNDVPVARQSRAPARPQAGECQITRSVKRCCGLFALLYHKIVLDCPFELPEVHRCVALDP